MILLPLPFKLVTCAKAELPKVLTVYHQAAKLGDVCNPLKSLSPVTPAIFFLSNCLLRIVSRLCRTSSVLMLIHSSYSQEKRTFTSLLIPGVSLWPRRRKLNMLLTGLITHHSLWLETRIHYSPSRRRLW